MKTIKIGRLDFNLDACKKMSKKEFIKQHEYFKDEVDLADAYDKIKVKQPVNKEEE